MAFPEAADACMAAGLDSLKWSVNAADEVQFEKIMGVAGKLFHTALDNVKSAWETRLDHGHKTGLYASSIRYDGELSACCFDATANWTMGDLNTTSFMEAWNSQSFIRLREAHLRRDVSGTVCENCIAY